MEKLPSYLLNLAGEYRICSELNKRGVFATITYGTRKGADVYAISEKNGRALKIEVKTSQRKKFVTGLSQRCGDDDPNSDGFWERQSVNPQAPDFWVLFQIRRNEDSTFGERFFVLSRGEMCAAQSARNTAHAKKYYSSHNKQPDFSTGVDNVFVADVEQFEDQWAKIVQSLDGPAGQRPESR